MSRLKPLLGALSQVLPSASVRRRTFPTDQAAPYLRQIEVPAASPWRQRQIAELEARLDAPTAQVRHAIRRMGAWRPKSAARFLVAYLHARDVQGETTRWVDWEGASLGFTFRPAADGVSATWLAAARSAGAIKVAASAAVAALLVFGVASALERREAAAQTLSDAEAQARTAGVRAQIAARFKRQAVQLEQLGAGQQQAYAMLNDLAWVSTHRRTDTHITAFHWIDGVTAVEADKNSSPFMREDRLVQRAERALRPGVWLWGVGRAHAAANAPQRRDPASS